MPGMQAKEMVHMTMLVFRIIHITRPFHQLAIAPNFIRNQLLQYLLPVFAFFSIHPQHFAGIDSIK